MEDNIYPRELTVLERGLLFSVLPENKSGYNLYRQKTSALSVIGEGRFGGGNLILGKPGTIPDISSPSAPVFAIGTVVYQDNQADIIIHEEIEGEIEIDISFNNEVSGNIVELKRWSYSEWKPGDKAPNDNSEIREIEIVQGRQILAIAPVHKKIWIYNFENGVNVLIPVTNFYNYLMMAKNIRNAELVFKPALLFSELNSYKDEELKSAFFAYNKYFKRIRIENIQAQPVKAAGGNKLNLFNIFKKDKS